MTSEIWQFVAFLAAVIVAFLLWLNIIYLPGRTLERRYDAEDSVRRTREEVTHAPGEDQFSRSSNDPTR